jgi:hypothetical protein
MVEPGGTITLTPAQLAIHKQSIVNRALSRIAGFPGQFPFDARKPLVGPNISESRLISCFSSLESNFSARRHPDCKHALNWTTPAPHLLSIRPYHFARSALTASSIAGF